MLKTLQTYFTEAEASIDLTFLESHQLQVYLFHSHASTVYPIFNSTIGGIELKVDEADYERALQLLARKEE